MKQYTCDVLVVGGGGAAVRAAIEACRSNPEARVILVDKGRFERSGTSPLGLHGLLTVLHEADSEEILFNDIVRNGCEISDMDLVHTAVRESLVEPRLLEEMGVRFVRIEGGDYDLYRGAGHSAPHGLTFDETENGINFVAVLGKEAWKRGVHIIEEVMINELIVDDHRVLGAVGVSLSNELHVFSAGAVVLAAGGANRIYPNVVPRIAHPMYRTTGDGYSLALRAGLALVDMEFANFRDTPPAARLGGRLINAEGEAFMERYEPERKEKAPRGNVVEAIYREMQAGRSPVYIEVDAECERNAQFLPEEYKAYVRAYKEGRRPPVTIMFQRLLGGARMNPDASSEIAGLYIAGENAGGFHGADRLQGAAFLETQVFGRLAGIGSSKFAISNQRKALPQTKVDDACRRITAVIERKKGMPTTKILEGIHRLTWDYASIVRDEGGLKIGLLEIRNLQEQIKQAFGTHAFEVFEMTNLALTAETILCAALKRNESRGTHRRSDFPKIRKDLAGTHTHIKLDPHGTLITSMLPK